MKQTVEQVSPVCIAGAHRSGTSMLARLLHEAGLELGPERDLMPAQADNPDGFWENLRFVAINDEVLSELGGAWDLPPAASERFDDARLQPLKLKARLLIESFPEATTWGWKDPRNSLTLPFWQDLLPRLKVVVMVRNPLEVAYSMHKRNGTSYSFGLRLWELYNRRLLAAAPENARLISIYDSFFSDPEAALSAIADFAGLTKDRISAAVSLVSRNRRHTSFTIDQMVDARVPPEIIELYRDLVRLSPEKRGTEEASDSSSQRVPELLPGPPIRLRASIPDQEAVREELANLRGERLSRLRQLAEQESRLQSELDARNIELGTLRERLTQRESDLASWRERVERLEQQLRDRNASLAERERRLGELNARIDQLLETTGILRGLLDRLEAAAARLRNSGRWKLSNPIPTLRHVLFDRPLLGPGDLEREVKAYAKWKESAVRASIETALLDISPLASYPPVAPTGPLEFSVHKAVDVSIVIPVLNHLDFTRSCLASIQAHTGDEKFEVIVVDDCSDDATADALSKIPGLVYVRNEANAGFIASCNHGASRARGRCLVFLNNDTEVRPGWLSALRRVFKLKKDAGLVGAKLVYADGRLQEAGGVIWQDASGANYGKGDNPNKPAYNYLREVDYCSGACILVPRALFQEVGGFDATLAPAYYEDTDLAFKIREQGRKVYYQPFATVIHHEGATSGTSTESGVKRFQLVNQTKFRAKWQEELRRQPVRETADINRSKDRGITRRVLVVDTRILCPDQDSGSLRMLRLLQIFQELGFKVSFWPENLQRPSPYTARMQELGIECLYAPFVNNIEDFLRQHRDEFDLIMLSRREIGEKMLAACRATAPSVPIIFDTVDLHFLREEREAQLAQSDEKHRAAAETRRRELEIAAQCDAVVVVSPFEKQMLEAELPGHRVTIISNIHRVRPSSTSFTGRRDFVFIGGFEHPPNIDAMEWFCAEIMPRIVQEIPTARLHIIGSKMPSTVRKLANANVLAHGYVEDVLPLFDSCLLSVAPLRYGAGVKGKINQSMSLGVPVVSTSIGAEGMYLEHERDILIADEPAEFARQVVRLHQDPALWDRLSQAGLRNIEKHFSFAAARANLEKLLRQLQVWPAGANTPAPPVHPSPAVATRPSGTLAAT